MNEAEKIKILEEKVDKLEKLVDKICSSSNVCGYEVETDRINITENIPLSNKLREGD